MLNLPLRKRDTSSSWGMLSSRNSQYLVSSGRFFKYSRQAWVGYNLLSSLNTTPQVFTSSSVNSIRGMISPLQQERIIIWILTYYIYIYLEKTHWNIQQVLTVCRPWRDQQSMFASYDRHCPWNPDGEVIEEHLKCVHWTSLHFFVIWIVPTYRMISIQLRAIHQDTVSTLVQVWNLLWEPRYIIHIWGERRGNELFADNTAKYNTVLIQYLQDYVYLPHLDKSYLEAPYPPRSHAFWAAGLFHSVARGCCRSPQRFQTQSCVV